MILQDSNTLKELIATVFNHMININSKIEDEWCRPREGFDATS